MAEADDFVERIYKQVSKEHGEGVISPGQSVVDVPKQYISMGPALDVLTTGGVEEGSWLGLTGNPGSGKTSTALSFAANAQAMNRPVFYAKVEGRLSRALLLGTRGLRLDRPYFNLISSQKGSILTAQKYLEILLEIIRTVPGAIVIIDSISTLCDEREMTDGVGAETRGSGAKLFSQFCRLASNIVPVNNTVVVGITHLISNTSGMGAQYVERAARMWSYICDYQLRIQQRSSWEASGRQIGFVVSWVCNKGKNGPPGRKGDSYIRFGVGIDRLSEAIEIGISSGVIAQSKSWLTLSYLERYDAALAGKKANGKENLHEMLTENPLWADWLTQEILAMVRP